MSKPTEKELEILQVLWLKGPSTVRMVNDLLSQKREVGYTTTLKFMQIMHEKGLISRERNGKTHIYKAEASESKTKRHLVDQLLDTAFKGSAKQLVMQVLGAGKSSKKELEEIREFLDKLDQEEDENT